MARCIAKENQEEEEGEEEDTIAWMGDEGMDIKS